VRILYPTQVKEHNTQYSSYDFINFLHNTYIFILRYKFTGSSTRTTCKMLFRKLKILTLISQYILSLMRFLLSNLDIFTFNSSVHNINTRLRLKLHKLLVRLKMYQWSSYYNCINIYNKIPDDLANLILNKKRFLSQLKKYLIDRPFYTL
jgi:hypothetical protein